MKIGDFILENEEKLYRAIYGSQGEKGQLQGGLGEFISKAGKLSKEEQEAEQKRLEQYEKELLARYDQLGGLVTKNGLKVKTGSFYDFDRKSTRPEPELLFETVLEGKPADVTEDEAISLETVKKKRAELKKRASEKDKPRKIKKPKVQLKDLD